MHPRLGAKSARAQIHKVIQFKKHLKNLNTG